MDLATVNLGSMSVPGNTVSVLLGNGNGTFAEPASVAVAISPVAITPGDFNGDGKTDLATADYPGYTVSVLVGNGNGTFAAATSFTIAWHSYSITTGDFNGDGKADLATANFGFNDRPNNSVAVLLNQSIANGMWIGLGDGTNWTDPANWSNNTVPGVNDDVLIQTTGAFTVNLAGANTQVHSLTLGNNCGSAPTLSLTTGGSRTLKVGALTINGSSKLDLNDNDMILDYSGSSQLAAIQNLINSARAGGTWTGSGITSTGASNANPKNTTLGAMEATDFKSIYGAGALFDGQSIDNTAVLVKYTYYGDADFNGVVNFDDYSRIDTGFSTNRTGWLNGDFDGNGVISFDDYSLIDLAFNTQGTALRPGHAPDPALRGKASKSGGIAVN